MRISPIHFLWLADGQVSALPFLDKSAASSPILEARNPRLAHAGLEPRTSNPGHVRQSDDLRLHYHVSKNKNESNGMC